MTAREEANEYISNDLGCVYRWNTEHACLEWAPRSRDGSYDFTKEGGVVEESMVGAERVEFLDHTMALSDVFRYVEGRLRVLPI